MKGTDPQKPDTGKFAQALKKLGKRLGLFSGAEPEEKPCLQEAPPAQGAEQPAFAAAAEAPRAKAAPMEEPLPQAAAIAEAAPTEEPLPQAAAVPEAAPAPAQSSAQEPPQAPEVSPVPEAEKPAASARKAALKKAAPKKEEEDKPVWAMLGITSHNRPIVKRNILERGCVPGNPSKKATYLVYDPDRAFAMKYWPEAKRREQEGTLILVPEYVLSLWSLPDPGYSFLCKNIAWKRLLLEHYFSHPEAWAREGKALTDTVDKWIGENSRQLLKYADHLLIKMYIAWLAKPEHREALDALPVSELNVPFLCLLWAQYCGAGREQPAGRFEENILQAHPLLLQALMKKQEYRAMFALLDLVRADEEEKKRSGVSDGYYTYSLVKTYLGQITAAGDTEASLLWLDYKNTRFPQAFTDEAEQALLAAELGQRKRPDIYLQNGTPYTFGRYPQTEAGEVQPIEWIVLEQREGTLLLISKYALVPEKFHEKFEPVTWEKCSLRRWLNGTFADTAFSAAERARLITSEVPAQENLDYLTDPGHTTQDRVFLLSIREAERYFCSDTERISLTTAYCESRFSYARDDPGISHWWLRTPGRVSTEFSYVNDKGYIYKPGSTVSSVLFCVRPCIRIRL